MTTKEKRAAYGKAWRQRKGPQYHRDFVRRARLEMIAAYGGVCRYCGETTSEWLSLDHIHNNPERRGITIKLHRVAGYTMYVHLRMLGWPKKGYRLLCYNCNITRQTCGDTVARRVGKAKKERMSTHNPK